MQGADFLDLRALARAASTWSLARTAAQRLKTKAGPIECAERAVARQMHQRADDDGAYKQALEEAVRRYSGAG